MRLPVSNLFLVVLILCVTASYTIVYTGIQSFREGEPSGGNSDTLDYLAMYRGEKISHVYGAPRVAIPLLVRSLPDPPGWIFDSTRRITDTWIATVKFGIVNFVFLALTGILFFYFLLQLDFSTWESLLGILLFYTARPLVQHAGVPMLETAGYFFLLLCVYAILREHYVMLVLTFLVGVFVKETVFLALPALLLSEQKHHKVKLISLLLPGFIAYYTFRFYLYHIDVRELWFDTKLTSQAREALFSAAHFNKLLDLFSSFGLLWIPALYALMHAKLPALLRRWSYLIVIMVAVIFLFRLDLGRILFNTFPVVIPLALYGIRGMLGWKNDLKEQAPDVLRLG